MIETLPREAREAGEAQGPQLRGRATVGPKRKGAERATWGEPSVVREEGAPALSSRGEVLLFGLLPPSPAPVKALSQAWFPLCSLDLLGD